MLPPPFLAKFPLIWSLDCIRFSDVGFSFLSVLEGNTGYGFSIWQLVAFVPMLKLR